MEKRESIYKDGYRFTRDGSVVVVQKVMDDGVMSRGVMFSLFEWDLLEFVSGYEYLKGLEESDALADLREAQWQDGEVSRDEAYAGWLTGGIL